MRAKFHEKGEGFPGQRIVVLPRPVIESARRQALLRGLLPTDIGYFPHALGHLRHRPEGAEQAIFIHCAKGAGWAELAGNRFQVAAGDLLVVPPLTPHRYGADSSRPWTIRWFHATGAFVPTFLQELGVTPERPVTRLGGAGQWLPLFEEVREAIAHGYTPLQLLQAAQALAHMLAVIIQEQRHGPAGQASVEQKIASTIDFMKRHLNQKLSLEVLAGLAGLSRSQYTARFKAQTGYAPMDYFTRLRMHRACQLLDTTELTVKAVADELGYGDPLYFSRVFRLINEISPIAYRQHRKG